MTSCGIDIERTEVACTSHGRLIGNGIRQHRHRAVVTGRDYDGGWREMAAHGILARPVLDQLFVVSPFLAKESETGSAVTFSLVHRNDRIEQKAIDYLLEDIKLSFKNRDGINKAKQLLGDYLNKKHI